MLDTRERILAAAVCLHHRGVGKESYETTETIKRAVKKNTFFSPYSPPSDKSVAVGGGYVLILHTGRTRTIPAARLHTESQNVCLPMSLTPQHQREQQGE